MELVDMIHMVTKVERQLKRKGNVWLTYNSGSSSSWKLNFKREGGTQPKTFTGSKTKPPKAKVDVFVGSKGIYDT
jgi:hypothetical protein